MVKHQYLTHWLLKLKIIESLSQFSQRYICEGRECGLLLQFKHTISIQIDKIKTHNLLVHQ